MGIQGLADLRSYTARQTAHQAQHGRCGHARYRGAKGQAQAFDGFRKRSANTGDVVADFQSKHRAVECDHHAQEGAQHAQHDEKANQVRRQRRAGQGNPFAFHTHTHRAVQRCGQVHQPVVQVVQVLRNVAQGLVQSLGGLAVMLQLPCADHVHRANHRAHEQHQQVRGRHGGGDPEDGHCAQPKGDVKGIAFHGEFSVLKASSKPKVGCSRVSSSASKAVRSSWRSGVSQTVVFSAGVG